MNQTVSYSCGTAFVVKTTFLGANYDSYGSMYAAIETWKLEMYHYCYGNPQ